MPDVGQHPPAPYGVPIGEALRALPLESPPRSAWAQVAPRPVRLARWPYALATAAALALALLLPVPQATHEEPNIDLTAVMTESARLERLLAAANEDPMQPADVLVLGMAFEDELAGIDSQLSAARPGSRDATLLWQKRLDVLQRYAELQSSRRLLASAGQPYETTLVSLY